jgi:transposase-like protein
MTGIKKKYSKALKFQAALCMIKGEKTIAEISAEFAVHHSVLHRWKKELLSKGPDIFELKSKKEPVDNNVGDLEKKIGQLTMEVDFLKKVSKHLM